MDSFFQLSLSWGGGGAVYRELMANFSPRNFPWFQFICLPHLASFSRHTILTLSVLFLKIFLFISFNIMYYFFILQYMCIIFIIISSQFHNLSILYFSYSFYFLFDLALLYLQYLILCNFH